MSGERCVHGYLYPDDYCWECVRARIVELEAQVRERDEALKVAWEALTYYADKRYFSERYTDGDLQCTADNALAHPLIAKAG